MNNLIAPAAAVAPVAGKSIDTSGKDPSAQTNYKEDQSQPQPNKQPIAGIDYSLFNAQGSADGATGTEGGTVGGTGGVGGAAGDGVGGVGEGFAGGPVRARRYADGGLVAKSADSATSPEELARRHREIYGDPAQASTQTTQAKSGGNPSDYIGQWAHDLSSGNMGGLFNGPAMRAIQNGDVLSAISPAMMIGKSIGLSGGGPVDSNYQMAQHLASQGRGRDTTLVHMSKPEVAGLGSLHPSGQMPINPKTGLPEADFLTDVLPGIAGTLVGSVVGMPWLGAAIGGLGTWAATGNLGKGILSGLMSFGLGSIGGQLADAGAKTAGDVAAKGAGDVVTKAAESAATFNPAAATVADPIAQGAAQSAGIGSTAPAKGFMDTVAKGFQNAPQTFSNIGQGIMNPQNLSFSNLAMPAMMAGSGAYGLYSANQPPAPAPNPMAMQPQGQAPSLTNANNPPRTPTGYVPPQGYGTSRAPGEGSFFQPNQAWGGYPSYAAAGGPQHAYIQPDGTPYHLAKGGVAQLPSGMIRGPGGGMDDKIKGTIDGRRDVYLSDGEYVVDAQAISALGDGSSEAGADRMKQIVEEIRQKKFGSKKQPPKMAELGGLASLRGV